jgi:hypothetical protein
MNRQLVFTLTALVLATVLQWYLNLPAPWPVSPSRWQLAPFWSGLKSVLPGALAGFIAGRHGLLLGALVGFLGRLAVTIPVYRASEAGSSALMVLSHAALAALGFAVVSAAGGGTGQLLRSNFR